MVLIAANAIVSFALIYAGRYSSIAAGRKSVLLARSGSCVCSCCRVTIGNVGAETARVTGIYSSLVSVSIACSVELSSRNKSSASLVQNLYII